MENNLNTVFDKLTLGELGVLENERTTYVSKFKKTLFPFIILFLAWTAVFFLLQMKGLVALIVPLVIILVVAAIWLGIRHSRFKKKFKADFKAKVIPALVKAVDERLSYNPSLGLMREYHESALFPHSIDRHRAEDTITAQFDKTRFSFGEIHTEYKTVSTDGKGNRQEHWHTIFAGLFFVGDFNKNFAGETIIDQDKMERMLGKLGRKFQSWNGRRKGELVKMDDPRFEKQFAIYATDEVECRYILTPSLMERILQLNEKTNKKICLSFRNSNIYVAYSFSQNLFEPRIFSQSLKLEDAQLLMSLIELMTGLVDDLNLNTRIWTKE